MTTRDSILPYTDTKPVGAADFYMAINATFRFFHRRLGREGLVNYWTDLGTQYFAPVSLNWKFGGIPAIRDYWHSFFKAEPGAEVEVFASEDKVTLHVKVCPAIKHLRENKREIVREFCQHCYYINEAIARPAGFTARVKGGNGSCCQTFHRSEAAPPPQNLAEIEEATSC